MKILKIIIGVVIILILFQGVRYLSLMTSVKYETQLEGIVEITEGVQTQIDKRSLEIEKSKQSVVVFTLALIILMMLLLIVYRVRSRKLNK
jgi:hypothetical protein